MNAGTKGAEKVAAHASSASAATGGGAEGMAPVAPSRLERRGCFTLFFGELYSLDRAPRNNWPDGERQFHAASLVQ